MDRAVDVTILRRHPETAIDELEGSRNRVKAISCLVFLPVVLP